MSLDGLKFIGLNAIEEITDLRPHVNARISMLNKSFHNLMLGLVYIDVL